MSQDKKELPSIVRLPSERWPGDSRAAFRQRAMYYIFLWLIFEVMIGALLPVITLALGLFDTHAEPPTFSEILSPRDLVLICVALAAARLPDLVKENTYKLTRLRIIAAMLLTLIVIVGAIAATRFEILGLKARFIVGERNYSFVLFTVTLFVIAVVWGVVAANESGSESRSSQQRDRNISRLTDRQSNDRSVFTLRVSLLVGCGIVGYAIFRHITRRRKSLGLLAIRVIVGGNQQPGW